MYLYLGKSDIGGGAADDRMVLDHDAVMQHGDSGRCAVGAVFLEGGRGIDDIVAVPLARFPHGVHQGRCLLVDAGRLSVHIGFVLVAVEDLDLVDSLQEESAVAATLAFALDPFRYAPLDVQLEVAKLPFRLDIARSSLHGENAVLYRPSCRAAFDALPLRKVLAVEEEDGIRRDGVGGYYLWLRLPVLGHRRGHGCRFWILLF